MNKPEKTKGRHIQVPCPDGKPGCLVMHFSKEFFITDEDSGYNIGLEAGLAYHKSVLDRLQGSVKNMKLSSKDGLSLKDAHDVKDRVIEILKEAVKE